MALIGEFEVAVRAADPNREPDQFKFCGELFTVSEQVGIIPLAEFAKAAMSGLDTAEMEGLAALLDLLAEVVIDEDQARFLATAKKHRATADDMMPIVQSVIEVISGRPTPQPSDSSVGLSTTGANLRASSSSEVFYDQEWKNTPFGRREMALNPERYANVKPLNEAAQQVAQLTG